MLNAFEKIKVYIKKQQANRQAKIRQEFLPEALEIVEKPLSPTGHLLMVVLVTVIMFFLIWSVVGKMDEVVTARGIIITVSGVQEIQTASGGIIEDIYVQEGSAVEAGQPIAKIDSTINEISLQNTTEGLDLLVYENELLNTIMQGKDISETTTPEIGSEKEKIYNYVKLMQDGYLAERQELENNLQQALTQVGIEEETLEKIKQNNEYLYEQKKSLDDILQYSNTEEHTKQKISIEIEHKKNTLEDYKKLYEAGAIAKIEVEELEIEIAQLQKDFEIQNSNVAYEDYENSLNKYDIENQIILAEKDYNNQQSAVELAKSNYNQILNSFTTLETNFQTNISNLIVQNANSINSEEANQEIQKISVKEQTLVSPVNGVVRTMEINTIGGVVASTQTIATVVPDESQMIIEINIQNKDIGYIQNGQEVVIKLDAFDFQEYGKLEGTVAYISPDAVWSDNQGWVYKAKIAIDEEKFKLKNPEVQIGVGMECTAEVKVGKRRIIDFFLEPLVEHFDGSLKVK